MPATASPALIVMTASAGNVESTTQTAPVRGQTVKKMKRNRKLPQAVNYAQPQWKHAASGIRCRADWRNALVFDTDAGLIIAYSRAHAEEKASEVLADQDAMNEELHNEIEDLFR